MISQLIAQRYGFPREPGDNATSTRTITDILSRRSCRHYRQENIPEQLIQTLLATAFSAPSKSDLQQSCVIRIQDRAKQNRIAALSTDISWIAEAPLFMVWCGDSRRIRRLSELRGHPFANDHLDAFMNAAVDAGIAMQTFIIAAESAGLGCCPVSQVRDSIDALSAELELPEWVFPVAGLCVGWPVKVKPVSLRLPLDVTVHRDHYDDSNMIDQVAAYDIRREKLEDTPPEKQRRVDQFGISKEYGWSEDHTRQYAIPAREDFGAYIRKQGFDLT
jgi:nitroreductase/FMN reductase [NAD(P)H]